MKPTILFRGSDLDAEIERLTAAKYFDVVTSRTQCQNNLVIGRYSVLPYYHELCNDLKYNGCKLINDFEQFSYVASMYYYDDIKDHTFPTWFDTMANIPMDEKGPFVVKGRTNSRKSEWRSLMYAKDRADAIRIQCELFKDPFIGPQGIVFRKYVPLMRLGESTITGQPYVNEWRFFFYKNKLLTKGFYWQNAPDDVIQKASLGGLAIEFASFVANILKDHTNFFCIDIAQKEDLTWTVVEVNDGQMAGLPNTEAMADGLYSNLAKALDEERGPKKFWVNTKYGAISEGFENEVDAKEFRKVSLARTGTNFDGSMWQNYELWITESHDKPGCMYDHPNWKIKL